MRAAMRDLVVLVLASLVSGGSFNPPDTLPRRAMTHGIAAASSQPRQGVSAVAATFVVTSNASTDDSTPGDGVCGDSEGRCTLRAALTEANALPGADTIHFNLPCRFFQGCLIPVISSTLPTVTGPVTIDGTTQSPSLCGCVIVRSSLDLTGGNSVVRGLRLESQFPLKISAGGSNLIENNRLSGEGLSASIGLSIVDSSNNVVQNNTIIGGTFHGVYIHDQGGGPGTSGPNPTSSNQIRGNIIGRAESGSAGANANGAGVTIESDDGGQGATNNVIENNVISGNTSHGVEIRRTKSTGNVVRGNRIGVNTAGTGALGNGGQGVRINGAPGNTVGGGSQPNIISANQMGVFITDSGGSQDNANNNRVQGNYIGLNASGDVPIGNAGDGIAVVGAVQTVTIEGNVVSWNSSYGIRLQISVPVSNTNYQVLSNYVGVNAAGTSAMPNGNHGIWIQGNSGAYAIGPGNVIAATSGKSGIRVEADGVQIFGNRIGTNAAGTADISSGGGISSTHYVVIGGAVGTTPAGPCTGYCNLISGGGGISITRGLIQGNYIGTDITGLVALGNPGEGITTGSNSVIGGSSPTARNVIGGNSSYGLLLVGNGSVVQGNSIGVGANGSTAIPNAQGIELTVGVGNPAGANTIGGTGVGEGNVVSGNTGAGIVIVGGQTGQVIQGNLIGVQANGSSPLGNGGHGVWVQNAAVNAIGGVGVGAGNVIAFNGMDGVFVQGDAATGNAILSNSIFSNIGLGIDLDPDGVTANDAGDADPGPNKLQNFPVLASAHPSAGTVVQGTLNSTANTAFNVQFFSNPSCDPSGNGEGRTYLGSTMVTTDGNGNAGFAATLPVTVSIGEQVTATATDPNGNTSEFSACVAVQNAPTPTATVTLSPTASSTPTITPTASPTPTLTVTATPTPSQSAVLTGTATSSTALTITATITPTPNAQASSVLEGQVAYQGRATSPVASWVQQVEVALYQPGSTVASFTATPVTGSTGSFSVTIPTPGIYDVRVKHRLALSAQRNGVSFPAGNAVSEDFGILLMGDSNGDDRIDIVDFSLLRAVFGTSSSCGTDIPNPLPCAEYDGNGQVDIVDFSLMRTNFGRVGPLLIP